MKLMITSLFSFVFLSIFAQTQSLILYVAFDGDLKLNGIESIANASPEFQEIQSKYALTLNKAASISEERLDQMEKQMIAGGKSLSSLNNVRNLFRVNLQQATDQDLRELALELEKLSIVRYTSLMSKVPVTPPNDIAPATPNYEADQDYIGPNPGVDVQFAWDMGLTGQGINIRDLEYGVNIAHEELNDRNVIIHPGMTVNSAATTDYTEHGTATIGILYSDKGSYGTSGLVHGANFVELFPEWTNEFGYDRVYAVSEAVGQSTTGDILMFEMQANGVTDYAPAEYDQPVWDLTRLASDNGIVVVAAAGNGNQDLDSPSYNSYMARGHSGAILVGAGSPNSTHSKLSFSTYGSRVDVQGWGLSVFSPGYGDALQIGGDFNQNYTSFSGTSSATPIVTSCVVLLQSYYHDLTGSYLDGDQLSAILKATGIPQGPGGHIGPLPNMASAIAYVDSMLTTDELYLEDRVLYPNPCVNELHLAVKADERFQLTIRNALGQVVLQKELGNSEKINVEALEKGVYMVEIVLPNTKSSAEKNTRQLKLMKL